MYLGPYILRLHAQLKDAFAAAPDKLFLMVPMAALLVFCAVGWVRLARRTRTLNAANDELKRDLAEVAKALENELKWRFATEAFNDQIAAAANDIAAKSTRELQQLLAAENFNAAADRTDATVETSRQDSSASEKA
jgi:hypothetical protein